MTQRERFEKHAWRFYNFRHFVFDEKFNRYVPGDLTSEYWLDICDELNAEWRGWQAAEAGL